MGMPAARIGDMHVCPMVNPGPVPHVGGPISIGCPTVHIGGVPAARVGDMATCVGPPDTIAMGSLGVMIGGVPAARLADTTAHGGKIVIGFPTVLIGDIGGGGGGGGGGMGSMESGGDGKEPKPDPQTIPNADPVIVDNRPFCEICSAFTDAASAGTPLVCCSGG